MLRNVKIAIAISVAMLGCVALPAATQAGWGHHHHGWGHHHRGYYGGGSYGGGFYGGGFYGGGFYSGLGYPRYGWGSSYTSLRIGIGWPGYTLDYPRRYPYIYPGSLSSFDYYSPYGSYPSIFGSSVASYYAPYYASGSYAPYGSSYYASSVGCGPSAGCAPVIAPSCCDPCAGYPAVTAPANGLPSYAPSTAPAAPADQAVPADATPSVRTLLPNLIPTSNLTRAGAAQPAAGQGSRGVSGALLTSAGQGAVQSVSAAKLVAPDIATDLVPLSKTLLQAADAIFAAGDYQQAAAAYARLTLRYGNHDELAVRRFIALVASGDCDQAAVMFETASLAEQPLLASALPAGGLGELYGAAAAEREKHVDYLAAYALKHTDDGLALAMVGTWLELDGQTARAQVFMQGAAALAPSPSLPTDSAHLVATDVSQ